MSKLTVTDFSYKTGSPFKIKENKDENTVHEEILEKSLDKNRDKCNELLQKVNKKTAEYQASKPCSGVFTEVVTHGAFTSKKIEKENSVTRNSPPKGNGNKSLLGFPSSANDLALDAKSDLESDPNISVDVKEKVIKKLFALVSMVQHVYESKVRIMTEFDKFKDNYYKTELRREKEHSEQLYKLNMNFQNEVIQSLQQMKTELDFSRHNMEDSSTVASMKDIPLSYDTNVTKSNDCNDEINL